MPKRTSDPILAELSAIKRLMVLSLIKEGTSQKQIAGALGVDRSQVSRMFPGGVGNRGRSNVSSAKDVQNGSS